MGNAKLHARILELENQVKQQQQVMEEDKQRAKIAELEAKSELLTAQAQTRQLHTQVEELKTTVESQDDKIKNAERTNTELAAKVTAQQDSASFAQLSDLDYGTMSPDQMIMSFDQSQGRIAELEAKIQELEKQLDHEKGLNSTMEALYNDDSIMDNAQLGISNAEHNGVEGGPMPLGDTIMSSAESNITITEQRDDKMNDEDENEAAFDEELKALLEEEPQLPDTVMSDVKSNPEKTFQFNSDKTTTDAASLRYRITELEAIVQLKDATITSLREAGATNDHLKQINELQAQLSNNAFKISKFQSDEKLNQDTIRDYVEQIKTLEGRIERSEANMKEKRKQIIPVSRHKVGSKPAGATEPTPTSEALHAGLIAEKESAIARAVKAEDECKTLKVEVYAQKEQLQIYAEREVATHDNMELLRRRLESLQRRERVDRGTMTDNNDAITVETAPEVIKQRLATSAIVKHLSLAPIDAPAPSPPVHTTTYVTNTYPFTFFGIRLPFLGINLNTVYFFLFLLFVLALFVHDYSSLHALRSAFRDSNQVTRELVIRGRNLGLRQTGGYWLVMLLSGEDRMDRWRFGVEALLGLNGVWDG